MIVIWPMLLVLGTGWQETIDADFVIRGGMVYDGTGQPGRVVDLAIQGDRIVGLGRFTLRGKPREVNASGMVVAPGFIDLHTHSDGPMQLPRTRTNLCYILQGVTTVVTGNCGSGPHEVAAYFTKLEQGGIGSNVIHQAPHNDIRRKVMGNVNRAPTGDELKQMEQLVDQAMRDGCWSLSTGLIYNPGTYSQTDEIIALAKVASQHGGFYASHIRDEGSGLLAAIEEALRIGREAKLPIHISHMKASGRSAWGKAADAVALVQQARSKGQAVTADQYPYDASSTSLAATVVPAKFREGTAKDFQARLADPKVGKQIRQAIQESLDAKRNGNSIQVARYSPKPIWQGKRIDAIAELEAKTPLEIVLEIEKNGGAQIVHFSMNDEDVRLIMKQPFVATASDGSSQVSGDTVPHPRSYGCFARKIGYYCFAEKLITPEQAIRSASGLPADILRIKDRGYIKLGQCADVVILDPKTYRDHATFDKPHQLATGVKQLFVNGKLVVENGQHTGVLAGKVLRHSNP